jgi:hypothetical protein
MKDASYRQAVWQENISNKSQKIRKVVNFPVILFIFGQYGGSHLIFAE